MLYCHFVGSFACSAECVQLCADATGVGCPREERWVSSGLGWAGFGSRFEMGLYTRQCQVRERPKRIFKTKLFHNVIKILTNSYRT